MDSNSRSTPDAPAVPVPDPGTGQDDPAVVFSRFPLARFDATPPVDPVRAGEAAAAARAALYDDPEVAAIAPHVDIAYYRAIYPDIARTSLDPVTHYHSAGWREGRRPNTWFDTRYYLQTNPDIRGAGIDPLLHFVRHGRAEGRLPERPGGELRDVLDRAMPPGARTPGYDAPRWAARLERADVADMLAAACVGARGLVVSVSHDRYIDITGGVQIFIADEQALFNGDRFAYLHISPTVARLTLDGEDSAPSWLQLVLDGRLIGLASTDSLDEALLALPDSVAKVRLFVVHSLFGHRASRLASAARALRARQCFFWLHDYASVCEGYNLLRDDVAFCHAPPPASMACRICVYGGHRAEYRTALRGLFEAVGFHVLAPSRAALDLWLRTAELPYRSAQVHANCRLDVLPAAPPGQPGRPVRVAFVGYAMAHKGWPIFRDLVRQLRTLEVYSFYHFSTAETLRPMDGLTCVPMQVDRYDRFAAVAALAEHAIDLVLVLSPWPETFSYVTYEALAAGADVVTLAGSGNVADAVRGRQRGVVLRDGEALLRFFRDLHAVRYADARRQAGVCAGVLTPCGTTATVVPGDEAADAALLATDDPDLCVIAGGCVVAPAREGDVWRFVLPAGVASVRLVSRWRVPAAWRQGAREQRHLGVAILRLELDGAEVPPDDPRRAAGWHDAGQEAWQWTSGDAMLRVGEATLLEVTLAAGEALAGYMRSSFAGIEP
jgi:hypothetical protein